MLFKKPKLLQTKNGFPWLGFLMITAFAGVIIYASSQTTVPQLNTSNNSNREEDNTVS